MILESILSLTESQTNSQNLDLSNLTGTESEKSLLADLNNKFHVAQQARLQFERKWYANMAFYFGRQYVVWSNTTTGPTAKLYEPPVAPWRVRLVNNKIRPIIRREVSKLTQENPTGYVIPSSGDEEDLAAARAGDAIFEHLWRSLSCRKTIKRAAFWTSITGNGFLKDGYDEQALDPNDVPGQIFVDPISPFHLYVPLTQEEELENQPYVIHATAHEPEWVEAKYGVRVAPDGTPGHALLEQKFLSALGVNQQQNPHGVVYVKELWMKPCPQFPKGTVVVWANNKILWNPTEGFPHLHNDYPFAHIQHIPTGMFYADSVIGDLIPLQKEYNKSRSQIVEAKNLTSKPQMLAQEGSLRTRKLTSEPGLIINYKVGFEKPDYMTPATIPAYVFEHLNRIQADMDDISSQHEVTKGRTPPGVSAATAISFLQEEDDSVLSNTIASIEEAVQKVGRHMLNHVQQNWEAERQIRVVGINGQFEAFNFSKNALNGNTDFYVDVGSAAPRSRAAKQAFIMEVGKMGWIPPEKALRYLDMTETGRMYEELQVDVRQAQRENLKMAQAVMPEQPIDPATGQPVPLDPTMAVPGIPVNSYDNHLAHIDTHNIFRKSQSYEVLPAATRMAFDMHVEQHKVKVANNMGMFDVQPLDPRLDMLLAMGPQGMLPVGSEEGGSVPQGGPDAPVE